MSNCLASRSCSLLLCELIIILCLGISDYQTLLFPDAGQMQFSWELKCIISGVNLIQCLCQVAYHSRSKCYPSSFQWASNRLCTPSCNSNSIHNYLVFLACSNTKTSWVTKTPGWKHARRKSVRSVTPVWFCGSVEEKGGDKWAYASFKQIDGTHYWLIKLFPFTIT